MNTELYNEEIDRFVRGELPAKEAEEITNQMKHDPALRRIVKLHQLTNAGLQRAMDKDIAQHLPSSNRSRIRSSPSLRIMAIAAVFALLVYTSYEYIIPLIDQEEKIEAPLQENPAVNLIQASEVDPTLAKAQQAFDDQEYQIAATLFEEFLQQGETINYEVLLYRGIALRMAEQTDEAQAIFTELVETSDRHYSGEEAQWQLALIQLQHENYDACREQLQHIINDKDNKKRKEARKLFRTIRFK